MCGYPAPSREKGKSSSATITARTGVSRNNHEECVSWPAEISSTLDTTFGTKQGLENQHVNAGCPMFVPVQTFSTPAIGSIREDVLSSCITKNTGGGGETQNPAFVLHPVYELHSQDSRVRELGDVCTTVSATYGSGGGNVPITLAQPIALAENTIGRKPENGGNGDGFTENGPMYTLNATGVHGVAQPIATHEVAGTMLSRNTSGGFSNSIDYAAAGYMALQAMQVRRLSPKECERLQGFPDNYTDIKLKGKPTPDGPRYKALGNSMAVPVMAWIGKRIQEVESLLPQGLESTSQIKNP
jgi:DNA (cytosine-5)-methyltransferase 1